MSDPTAPETQSKKAYVEDVDESNSGDAIDGGEGGGTGGSGQAGGGPKQITTGQDGADAMETDGGEGGGTGGSGQNGGGPSQTTAQNGGGNQDGGGSGASIDDWDEDLKAAMKLTSDTYAARYRTTYENATRDTYMAAMASFKVNDKDRDMVFKDVLDAWIGQKTLKSVSIDNTQSDGVKEEIKRNGDAVMNAVGDAIIYLLDKDSGRFATPKQKRAVSRAKTLLEQKASYYALLGVTQNASTNEILKATKKVSALLHPDHNNVEGAAEYFAAIQNAGNILSDKQKRRAHDKEIENNPAMKEAISEEFANNAFDSDDEDGSEGEGENSDDDGDIDDGDTDEEANYPPPGEEIKKLHSKIGKGVKAFFKELDSPMTEAQLNAGLFGYNKEIEEINRKLNAPKLDLFIVPSNVLQSCQLQQQSAIKAWKGGETKPKTIQTQLQGLQNYFVMCQRRGIYQWPEEWTAFLMEPLPKRLIKLKLPKEQAETKAPSEKNPPPVSSPHPAGSGAPQVPGTAKPSHINVDRQRSTSGAQYISQKDVPHTEIRDLACAYNPKGTLRFAPYFKLFVEVKAANDNRLMFKGARDLEDNKILDCMKRNGLHNIRRHQSIYCTLPITRYSGIKGVAWDERSGGEGVTEDTWVWVTVTNVQATPENEGIKNIPESEGVMDRSAFRDWLGHDEADHKIDRFLFERNIIPPWSREARNDRSNSANLRLEYPLPSNKSNRRNNQVARRNDYDEGYHSDEGGNRQIRRLNEMMTSLTLQVQQIATRQEEHEHALSTQTAALQRLLEAPPR
jgi:curved DNA-binding protein CbpA